MSAIHVGTAPDSWGVWFPENEKQTTPTRFLDEVAEAGYQWIELGPYGFLPTNPAELSEELSRRDLRLSAGTISERLHQPDSWDAVWTQAKDVAALTTAVGGRHIVVLPEMHRDLMTGDDLEPRTLTSEQWGNLTSGLDRLGRALHDEFGVQLQFHPHADSHVDTEDNIYRLLESTDPEWVSLCLDTGHVSYCGGDNLAIIRKHPDRIGYLHLKQVNPAVLTEVAERDLPFSEAVKLGAMTEPPLGVPDMPPLLDAVSDLGIDVFAIVEQDMYPCAPDAPLPIARRTRKYLAGCSTPAIRFN